jgi:hypothetical protein
VRASRSWRTFLGADFADAHAGGSIALPGGEAGTSAMESRRVTVEERPALAHMREGSQLAAPLG